MRFCGQFEVQIHTGETPAVTKFSYLKELVDLRVRKLIDGLPFTAAGYEKAVSLLKKRFGQTDERYVAKIHEFYNSMLFNVESLQTLKKLNEIDAAYLAVNTSTDFDRLFAPVVLGHLLETKEILKKNSRQRQKGGTRAPEE